MTSYDPGWFNLSRTCHVALSWIGYCDVIDLSFVIYISMSPWYFYISDRSQWSPQLPSNKTNKYLLARSPVPIWSFSIVYSLLKSSYFFSVERGRRHIFYGGERNYNPPPHLQRFFGNRYRLHDQVGRFTQISDRGAWALSPALRTREKFDFLKESNLSRECVQ